MRTRIRAWAVIGSALVLVAAASGCTRATGKITIEARYSRFTPASIEVEVGTTVTFEVTNRDPIAHEFIIGTAAEQILHETGTQQTHDGAPGAASLDPGETETVTLAFEDSGQFQFACHVAGHYDYGMFGTITVT